MTAVMHTKKVIALALVMAMVFTLIPVYALAAEAGSVTVPEIVFDTETAGTQTITNGVTLTATYLNASGKPARGTVTFLVTDPDGKEFYADKFITGTDGQIEVYLKFLQTDPSGSYKVVYGGAALGKIRETSFTFVNQSEAADILAALNSGDLKTAVDTYKNELGVSDAYAEIETSGNDSAFYAALTNLRPFASCSAFADQYNIGAALSSFNDAKTLDSLDNTSLQKVMASKNAVYKTYYQDKAGDRSTTANGLAAIEQALPTIADVSIIDGGTDFVQKLNKIASFALMNEVDASSRNSFITYMEDDGFKAALGLGNNVAAYQTYAGMGAAQKRAVASNLFAGNYGSFTPDNIIARFTDAVNKANAGTPFTPGGGGDGKGNQTTKVTGGGNNNQGDGTQNVTLKFTDVDLNTWNWLIEPLQEMVNRGFISGRSETIFAPADSITRAEYLNILMNMLALNVSVDNTVKFADVNPGDWFFEPVMAAEKLGIVYGRSETEFAPNDKITREEICMMTMRAVRVADIYMPTSGAAIFADQSDIATYAVDDVMALKSAGVISGRGNNLFAPKDNATRAEATVILFNVWDMYY